MLTKCLFCLTPIEATDGYRVCPKCASLPYTKLRDLAKLRNQESRGQLQGRADGATA